MNRKLRNKSRKSRMISELDVAPEIVVDPKQIVRVSGKKQVKKRTLPEAAAPYKFKPGQSGNPSGRPPDLVKGIAMRMGQLKAGEILSEAEQEKLVRLGLDKADITVIETIILDWATSSNPIKQQMYIERIAGKVPNVNINAEVSAALVTRFRSKFTDAELERIAGGEEALEILLEKLPDVSNDNGSDEDEELIEAEEMDEP